MEKKQYMKPLIEVIKIGKPQLLSGSGVRGASTNPLFEDIDYGGVDVPGTIIPQ